MAASTEAASRLGPNDRANVSEALINLVSENKRNGAETRDGEQRLAQKGCGPFETLRGRLDTSVRPSGKRNCLSRSFMSRNAELSNPVMLRREADTSPQGEAMVA